MSRSMARGEPSAARNGERTLSDTMMQPSVAVPEVVVLDSTHVEEPRKIAMSATKDLWLSTVDGRHQSPIIPIRCGPYAETFYVHKDILTKEKFFRNALNGKFREADEQAIDLAEEDPALFSFVVAYLYEGKYAPIKPASKALVMEPAKGKGREGEEGEEESETSSSSDASISGSDDSIRSTRRFQARQRRQQRNFNRQNRKEPGRHRLGCQCPTCFIQTQLPTCWNCGMGPNRPRPPRRIYPGWVPPPGWVGGPPPPPPPGVNIIHRQRGNRPPGRQRSRSRDRGAVDYNPEPRMDAEDMRTWLMAYELSIDVYICADRYCMDDFKGCIRESITDYLETAGVDAAQPLVLECCKKLYAGLSPNDVLLKMVFARVGFLLARLWKNFAEQTHLFWIDNPEVGGLITKETMQRREMDAGDALPAMNRLYLIGTDATTTRSR